MKKLLVIFIILSTGCATFRHNAIPVDAQIVSLLEDISKKADEAQAHGVFTDLQRKQFAAVVMVPAIKATEKLTACLSSGNCKDITVALGDLSRALLIGINNFVSQMPNSDLKTQLLGLLKSTIDFVTNLYIKLGGKVEAENYQVYSLSLSQVGV